jgi:hypothetical protein
VRLTTLPPSCAVVMKSGNLNFLERSGPLQAGNGTALPSLIASTYDKVPIRPVCTDTTNSSNSPPAVPLVTAVFATLLSQD